VPAGEHRHRGTREPDLVREGDRRTRGPHRHRARRAGRTLAARGWTRDGGDLLDVLGPAGPRGCARYVVTDVNKDGMLQGPNVELLRTVCARTDAPVIASGGISTVEDLLTLAGLTSVGVEGAIIGTALYTGAFTLEDALAAVAGVHP
jgi:phosphoribosylanthranilate isomerase